jgi:hypothetical protein
MLIRELTLRPRLISANQSYPNLQVNITIIFRSSLLLITKDHIHVAGQYQTFS